MTKIKNNLYLGNLHEAITHGEDFDTIVCTMDWTEMGEENERFPYQCLNKPVIFYCPILRSLKMNYEGVQDEWACKDRLNLIAAFVWDEIYYRNRKVLVHCAAAIERSPLTVAWILHRASSANDHAGGFDGTFDYRDFDAAYDYVKSIHPQTADRKVWLRS